MRETSKCRVLPYFVIDGNVCALLAAKDHVNLFLYDGAMTPDPAGLITGATTTRRHGGVRTGVATRSMGNLWR